MPIRFDLTADDNLLWELFDYVGKRADVISCSWGPVPVFAPLNSLLSKQFTELSKTGGPRGKGCVIVFAAGNYNAPIKDYTNSSFTWRHPSGEMKVTKNAIINGHAQHKDVITVAASTSQNRKAAYSNWGKEITVCAPSDNWHPHDPNAYVPGRGIWTTDNEDFGLGFSENSQYTGYFGGTSSATPLVAGIAALMIAANPDLTAKQVKTILKETSDKIVDKSSDPVLKQKKGTYKSGHSEWFGHGKVNAAAAVAKAKSMYKGAKKTKKEEAPKPKKITKPKTTAAKSVTNGIVIVAAMVNPKGKETGAEKVSLLNITDKPISIGGWVLMDQKNRKMTLEDAALNPGAFLTITLNKLKLTNSGGQITLLNEQDKTIDSVTYDKRDAGKEGWTVRF